MNTVKAIERSPRLAELKVSYRRRPSPVPGRLAKPWNLTSPAVAAEYLRSVWNKDTLELIEDFLVVCLDGANQPLGWLRVSSGGLSSTNVDPRVIFSVALQAASSGILVAHNHPSGSLQPSPEDRAITKRLQDAGRLLCIRFVDHVILTKDSYFSLAEHGFCRPD